MPFVASQDVESFLGIAELQVREVGGSLALTTVMGCAWYGFETLARLAVIETTKLVETIRIKQWRT